MNSTLEDRIARIPTAALCDALDRMGALASAIGPMWRGARLHGPAFTVRTAPGDNRAIQEAIGKAPSGAVLVIDGGGHTCRALIGEIIAHRAQNAGLVGLVVDGAVRDVVGIEASGLPVFARAVTPAGPYHNGPGQIGIPISIAGQVCVPGDCVVADADGVVIVPAGVLAACATEAERIMAVEDEKLSELLPPSAQAALNRGA